jgi:hypothetical protein
MARTARVPTRVESLDDRYPPEIEAAVYFSCALALEAVEPAAHRSTVRVWPEGGSLLFEVAVEGGGFGASDLSELVDRVGAAGGSFSISLDRLLGTIPLVATGPR